jgi:carboxyl-terminal processing protease
MAKTEKKYTEIYSEPGQKSYGAVIVTVLVAILFGLFGYYLGDSGSLKNIFSQDQVNASKDFTEYSQEELSAKLKTDKYDFELYQQVVANIKDKYINLDKVDDKKLFEGSLKGMVDSIGDPATVYFSPEAFKEYEDSFSGQFDGIGVRVEYANGQIVVSDVLPNSPALAANVRPGYIFYKVDGKDITNKTIDEVIGMVRGKAGTKVKLVFIDPANSKEVEKEIERAALKIDSMRLVEKNKDTVIFEIARFTEASVSEWDALWDKNVKEIVAKGYKNIILDLRGDGGGYLDAAIYAASDFLDSGKLVVSEKSRIRASKDNLAKSSSPRLKGKNVVILVNGGTASASEIFAGALSFHNGYKIIGTKTYGKGTVQNTYPMPDGGALKITTEYWLLPNGKKLDNENPILPNIEVSQDFDKIKQGVDNVINEAMKQFN